MNEYINESFNRTNSSIQTIQVDREADTATFIKSNIGGTLNLGALLTQTGRG